MLSLFLLQLQPQRVTQGWLGAACSDRNDPGMLQAKLQTLPALLDLPRANHSHFQRELLLLAGNSCSSSWLCQGWRGSQLCSRGSMDPSAMLSDPGMSVQPAAPSQCCHLSWFFGIDQ